MHPKSAELICFLRLSGFKERNGSTAFVNFVIEDSSELQICIHKCNGEYYFIRDYTDTENICIDENTIQMIMDL